MDIQRFRLKNKPGMTLLKERMVTTYLFKQSIRNQITVSMDCRKHSFQVILVSTIRVQNK